MSSPFVRLLTVVFSFITFFPSNVRAATSDSTAFEEFSNDMFGLIVDSYSPFLFWEVPLVKMPLIVFIMLCGGIFFTFRFGFINLRLFKHAFDVAFGRYDNRDAKDKDGEVSHFQALTAALSATVGLGNIAGVAVAISQGGPGAVFWMWITAFFGMSLKFSSCTLAIMYRTVGSEGRVLGGPMVYLSKGLKEMGREKLGKFFGALFAVCAIMSSFGGGNLFQSNQTYAIISINFPNIHPLVVGVTLSFFAAIVLVGGIKRIGEVTSRLVPLMCGFYVLSCLFIIVSNYHEVPAMFSDILRSAYSPDAIYGGFLGVLVIGITRASFSSEAGLGSAAIAHSAAKTKEPVREGLVGMIEPFIDTHMVCTMTALAILITNSHLGLDVGVGGVEITGAAFASIHPIMPYFLMLAIIIFAYSTVISWSYYGERATEYLFGDSLGPVAIKMYRTVYVFVIILGPLLTLGNVVDFADLMLLSMAFPNILGMVLLSKITKKKVMEYQQKLKSGGFALTKKS
jgi:AGCS family alanine or glycine:cation symporter